MNKFPKQFQFFVILKNVTRSEISSLEDSEILHFQYFLLDDKFSIKLLTFVWYTPEKCATPQLKEVNKFNGRARKWKLGKFSLIKNKNFYGCELVFGAHRQRPAFEFEIQFEPEQKLSYSGFHYNMIRNIANALNFSLTLNPISRYGGAPLFKNLSIDISMQLAPFNFYILFTDIHSFTYPYMYYYDFILVPPGEDYTEYEKLFLPFDVWVWYLIVFTFAVSFTTIFILNFTKPGVKYFVYGKNVQTPSLNVTMIFFGISQIVVPARNFARYLVMVFIMYCLIIRTAYQGKMFEFMQKNMTQAGVQSVDELIDRNFTLHFGAEFAKLYNNSDIFKRYENIHY